MKISDFFVENKTGKASSARLVFIFGSFTAIICVAIAYLWVIFTKAASFENATLSFSSLVLPLAGKVSVDSYVAYKHGNTAINTNSNPSSP